MIMISYIYHQNKERAQQDSSNEYRSGVNTLGIFSTNWCVASKVSRAFFIQVTDSYRVF